MKRCKDCGETKPPDAYYSFVINGRRYLKSYCKPCHVSRSNAWGKANRPRTRERQNQWRAEHREHVNAQSRERHRAWRAKTPYILPRRVPGGPWRCPACHETKPVSEFYASQRSACKACRDVRTKDWQRRNPERARAIQKRASAAYAARQKAAKSDSAS